MLDWFSRKLGLRKASEHPLATRESLQEIIEALPAGNPLKALADLGDWLSMADRPELDPNDRIVAICTLDEQAQRLLSEVMLEYLACAPTHHRAEQTWYAMASYCGQAFDAHHGALRDLFDASRPLERDKAGAAVFAARAMSALTERRKLNRMRYRTIEPALWSDLYGTFLLAQQIGVLRKSVKLPGRGVETSAYREFLASMWFELAPIGSLDHVQMEYLDRVIREFLNFFTLREEADAETPFMVDLEMSAAPQRWSRDKTTRMSRRYLGPGQIHSQLIGLVREVRRSRALPTYLALQGIDGVQACVNLVDKLILHWSKTPPRRVHDRAPIAEGLEVVHGYREIRRLIAGIAYLRLTERSAEDLSAQQLEEFSRFGFVAEQGGLAKVDEVARLRAMIEEQNRQLISDWVITDVSDFGCGAIAQGPLQWLQVGILLGLRWGAQQDWSAGVVRRLSRNARGQATVGVQRFAGVGRCARIGALDKRQVSVFERSLDPGVSVYFDAIALLEDNSVLVEPGVYIDNARFRLVVDGRRTTIKFLQLLERGANFEHVRYEVEPDLPA